MPEGLRVRKDVPSGTIILNRPNRRNALDRRTVEELQQAFEDFHGEKKVRAVIITGSGSSFCSGTDLRELQETQQHHDSLELFREDVDQLQTLLETMLRYPKPIVAAVNGWAVGVGLAIVLACDYVIANEHAKFWLPESQRGLSSGLTVPLLAFRTGVGVANPLVFGTAKLTGEQSLRVGVVHEIVGDEVLWARAHQVAVELSAGAPHAHLLTKQLINETIGESLFTQMSVGAMQMATARTTENAIEGVTAFLESRPPNF